MEYFILGISDEYERLDRSYNTRFGIIPVSQKLEKLKDLEEVEIYSIGVNSLRGFLVRGMREGGQTARVQMIDAENEFDIRVHVYGRGATDNRLIGAVLSSLQVHQ